MFAAAIAWGFREGCACVKKKEAGDAPIQGVPIYLPGKETIIIDTQYIPTPYSVTKKETIMMVKTDTVEVPVIVEVSEGTAYYRDSLPVSHGYAIIQDTVAGNRITGRNFRLNQSLPIVRETVAEKKKNVVYLGLNAQGSKQNFFYSIGADVSLKAKNDRIYSLGVGVTKDNQLLYGAGFRWPVRLRK